MRLDLLDPRGGRRRIPRRPLVRPAGGRPAGLYLYPDVSRRPRRRRPEHRSAPGLELVTPYGDALDGHAPATAPLAGTRTAEALLQGRPLREPVTGRRPDDLYLVPAGLRQVAVTPLRCAGVSGTLQLARRLPRPY